MLESRKKGDTVVIWDPVLPKASTGKLFLYHTGKERLIEYVEEIVCPKLRDLTQREMRNARQEFSGRWEQIRVHYLPTEDADDGKPEPKFDDPVDDSLDDLDTEDSLVMDGDIDMD